MVAVPQHVAQGGGLHGRAGSVSTFNQQPQSTRGRVQQRSFRLERLRCQADRSRQAVLEEVDRASTSYSAEDRAEVLSSVGLGLLSSRLGDIGSRSQSRSTSPDYRRSGGREGWKARTDAASERIRQLAREVNDVSASAQAAVMFANDEDVGDLRNKLHSIEEELRKLNLDAERSHSRRGRRSTTSLITLPAPLREAVEEATTVTPTPVWVPPPMPEAPPQAPPQVQPAPQPAPQAFLETPVRAPVAPVAPPSDARPGIKPEGTGREVLLQGFNWESHKHQWWNTVREQADWLAGFGFTVIWLPPPTDSVSAEGYLPRDLYNLNSKYGSADELKRCIRRLQECGFKVLGDAVLNHRCAQQQDSNGIWNVFGGKMAWDARAISGDDPNFRGRGNKSTGDIFHAAPNIDHTQEFVRRDICEWLVWLRETAGFDGWRLDFVRGFTGEAVGEYMEASQPQFAVGEYWDTLAYNWEGVPEPNQDAHRHRIIKWLDATGGRATAFDVTTKGILHAVFERCEYWRLRGQDGKPPGVLGAWPSRAILFLENHDTGSTQGHWRFPQHGLEQGYVYIMTHPGTPTVFYDHLSDDKLAKTIRDLTAFRKRTDIHCRSNLVIHKAERDVYVAEIDNRVLMKIGPGDVNVDSSIWNKCLSGHNWAVWERR